MGRFLVMLQWLSALLIVAATVMGYLSMRDEGAIGGHVWAGFLIAIVIAFTHAMTLFWFAGMGVGMREAAAAATAAGGKAGTDACLAKAAVLRKRVALPLGVALVSLMAAVILGGGAHTRALSSAPHHIASMVALVAGLFQNVLAVRSIVAYESVVRELETLIAS